MVEIFRVCDYGCGQKAKYYFPTVDKWCCSKSQNSCLEMRKKNSSLQKGEKSAWYGKKHSQEAKDKIRKANKGKKHSQETKEKIRKANKGKKHSQETKEKIRKSSKNISEETREKMSNSQKGRKHSEETKKKIGKQNKGKNNPMFGRVGEDHPIYGRRLSIEERKRISQINKGKNNHGYLTIEKIKKRYPFFSQIENLRYNPDKPREKEIQVHCKNHLCPNSKEQDGWFTPSRTQLAERIRQLENEDGNGGSYFYCSEECKEQCPLFNLKSDPLKKTEKSYTQEEYEIFRKFVLERDNYQCQYCGESANIIHHERPQKLEPFFALDPDFTWSVCEKCHYKYGHKTSTECSTGNLAKKVC